MRRYVVLLGLLAFFITRCDGNSPADNSPDQGSDDEIQSTAAYINFDEIHQVVRGFGAANIVGWRPDMTDDEIEKAFGTADGQLGLSILRLRIAPDASQFSANVPTAREAHNRGVKIVASPWTPPPAMKTNTSPIGGRLGDDRYAAYAAYLNSFNTFMEENGIPLYAISVQNEPDIDVEYESAYWSPEEMTRFMTENADAIDTRVMAPESFQFRKPISDAILATTEAAENLDIIGGHIYGGGLEAYPLAEEAGKEVWMTEHYTTSDRSANLWPDAPEVGNEMHQVMNANMNAYIWWYLVRYYGPIGDGEEGTTKGEITKRGYVMSHFSRFIRPGYVRIGADANPQAGIYVSAYEGDGRTVIVAINRETFNREQQFVLENSTGTISSVTPYITSETENVSQHDPRTISQENQTFTYQMPAQSIVTFVGE